MKQKTAEDWAEWIERCLDGKVSPNELRLGRDQELHETFITAYTRSTRGDQRQFEQALVRLLGSIPLIPSNAERFFRLLQVVAVVRPVGGDTLVRRFLADGIVPSMVFDGRPLRNVVISVAAQYPVDQWLTEFLWKTVKTESDFQTILVCFRCLSFLMDDSYLEVLPKLISHLDSEKEIARLARQLFAAIGRNHCKGLRKWYIDHYEWLISLRADLWRGFRQALLDALSKVEDVDDHARLLLAEVKVADRSPVPPEHLVKIAHMDKRMEVDVRETLERLQRQWHLHTGEYLWSVRKLNARQFKKEYVLTDENESFILTVDQEVARTLGNTVPADLIESSEPNPVFRTGNMGHA